jgi:D-glycero-D-manno-heptose 1,7-bisphosphate phosphatase
MDNASEHGKGREAIFLDRDGVINRKLPENYYVSRVSQFEFLPGATRALSILRQLGYLLVVVTNQRGIARKLMTEEDLETVHSFMRTELEKAGATLDAVYHCPHEVHDNCRCRKPQPGMVLDAAGDLNIDLNSSYLVGDSKSDVEAGKKAGTRTVQICEDDICGADMVFPSLLDFAQHLQKQVRG